MRRTLLVLLALELSGAPAALADGRGTDLASPALPTATAAAIESHHDDGGEHGDGPRLDLLATTLVPLAVGGAMHLDLLAGFFLRVQASVVVPAYVDAINDVGQGYGVWDDGTASAISGLLVDAVIFEGAVGVRPGGGPLELSVAYFMFWREGSAPAMMGLGARPLSVTVYAVHPELTLRMPLTDVLVMRVSLGWVHAVGTDARLGRLPEDGEAEDAARSAAESTIASWPAEYGMGPTLSASVGIHFE